MTVNASEIVHGVFTLMFQTAMSAPKRWLTKAWIRQRLKRAAAQNCHLLRHPVVALVATQSQFLLIITQHVHMSVSPVEDEDADFNM